VDEDIADLIARLNEENRRHDEAVAQASSELDIVNGAMRAIDGTFWLRPERSFRADGREEVDRDELTAWIEHVLVLLECIRTGDVADAMAATRELKTTVDAIEHEMIAIARGGHWAWRDIGEALGMHPSSAHRRFARELVEQRKRRRRR
jgi:hypothetical protein